MTDRNLSPQEMFIRIAGEHRPKFQYEGFGSSFEEWREKARPEVMSCLGRFPEKVDARPELLAEWEHRGLRKQKWVIDAQPHLSANLYVNIPPDAGNNDPRPALLCWHGHGNFGKEPVMGNDSSPVLRENIRVHNYEYGQKMAEAGFITFAVDWIGAGDHSDDRKPNWRSRGGGRDWCNLYYLHATMLGMTSISINVRHGMAATDFVSTLPFVDENRLGVMGLSGGGTMTTWTAFCDERIKAAEIICYSDVWRAFGIRDANYCGMQVAPGLFDLVDLPDLQGLLAPLPLLIDIGSYDDCFTVDTAMECFRKLEKIYEAAGVRDRLELDLFGGGHGWGGNKSVEFFRNAL